MIYLTVDRIMAWGPCPDWPRKRIARAFGKRKRISLLDVLGWDGASVEDRVWLGCRALPEREARLLACLWATRMLKREREAGYEPDEASWAAIRVARRVANGKASDADLAAARMPNLGQTPTDTWRLAGRAAWQSAWGAACASFDVADQALLASSTGRAKELSQQLRDIIRVVKALGRKRGRA